MLESVYEAVLARELVSRGLRVQRQVSIPINWRDMRFDEGFRADLIVEEKVIIELKSIEKLSRVHFKQIQTYLKLMDLRLGLLVNFGEFWIKDGMHRIANNLKEEGYVQRRRT